MSGALSQLRAAWLSPGCAGRWMWWEVRAGPSIPGWTLHPSWTLHPRLDQEEEAEKERFVLTQGKPLQKVPAARAAGVWSNGNGVPGQWQQRWSHGVEKIVKNKEGMSTLGRPAAPACRTDGPSHHCLGNSHWSVQNSCLWGLLPLPPSCGAVTGLWHHCPLRATWAGLSLAG